MSELLIGCGARSEKLITVFGRDTWRELVRLDNNPAHQPDVMHDLWHPPLPFRDNTFEEIHAYHVLEHVGQQGDWRFFFDQWADFWRILRPGGAFCGIVPAIGSRWAWGDPSHSRVIQPESLLFLDQEEYRKQVGVTPMSDFRHVWKGDFVREWVQEDAEICSFVLRAVKPARNQASSQGVLV